MEILVYGLTLIGSVSAGYSLLRIGFPSKQDLSYIEKGAYGLILGTILFAPAIYAGIQAGISAFFVVALLGYLVLFTILYTKRFFMKQTDSVELIKRDKFKEKIPRFALTKEEKEQIDIDNGYVKPTPVEKPAVILPKAEKPAQIKEQIFKEKENNLVQEIKVKSREDSSKESEEKKAALEKLRSFGKEISKKNPFQKKESSQELEELEEEEEY